jgi:NADH-quinone oxidoreductase subunit N
MGLEIQLGSPIILITVFTVIALVIDGIWNNKAVNYYFSIVSLLIVAGFGIYTMTVPAEQIATLDQDTTLSRNMLIFGGFPAFFDVLFSVAGVLALFAAKPYIRREYMEINEFYSLFLTAIAGMMYIVHANNLLVLFIGIETMSVSFYVMAGFFRKSLFSVEAALKYFLLGAFITGFLVYGIAMIYGGTGSMYLDQIQLNLMNGQFEAIYFAIGFAMLMIAISFKVAAFPFHQWAPDVYHGSPTIIAGFYEHSRQSSRYYCFYHHCSKDDDLRYHISRIEKQFRNDTAYCGDHFGSNDVAWKHHCFSSKRCETHACLLVSGSCWLFANGYRCQ